VFTRLLNSARIASSAPRGPCQAQARFSKKIDLPIGAFTRSNDTVLFRKGQHFDEVPSESPLVCLIKVGPTSSEYLAGRVGGELSPTSRNDCLNLAFSHSQIAPPSRLRHLFSYRKKLNEWHYKSACPVFYELNDGHTKTYNRLMKCGADLSRSPGRYFDVTENFLETLDLRKRNAGAARLLDRNYLQVSNSAPLRDRFNFAPLAFHEHFRSLYFLPDSLVVATNFTNIYYRYEDVQVNIFDNRFVTPEVPYGVQPIDYTWQYVNKNGGPDRRFNDNYQIPIIAVTELDFHFSDGLEIHTAFTDGDAVENFGKALASHGARL